ncbi:DUF5597 domain-containing protein [Kineococcus gypseus]|uniref:GH35 family beta-galactosidase n=1 Tax=Kineococcus gypseus TaxID=1637102 RepID=UPI003D7ED7EF
MDGERTQALLPRLERSGSATRLIVDQEPFIIRGGELGNSSVERAFLQRYWPKLQALGLNTIVAPVYWDVVEPEEGVFNWSTVDELIDDAREHGMRLVLLWFGTWKNSMSCYAPSWVKTDFERFPRCRDSLGRSMEILTPFGDANREADARAFTALMAHLRSQDEQHAVVLVQVENEIGMIPEARDHSPQAEAAFNAAVPGELISYLQQHREELAPELLDLWTAAGERTAGTWTEVFGAGPLGEEVFMAWSFARYVQSVTAAGKAELGLPMYTNAALIRPATLPGQYPSAGPLPHLIDVWRAGAPSLDFIAPDIYFPNFAEWAGKYTRSGNPLFIPEALRSVDAAANCLYAYGAHSAIGFAVFGVESISGRAEAMLAASNDIVRQLSPLIAAHAGDSTMTGLLPPADDQRVPHRLRLGDVLLDVTYERIAPPSLADGVINESGDRAEDTTRLPSAAIVIQTADKEFVIGGMGVTVTFSPAQAGAERFGILSCEEGGFEEGLWQHLRWLNGDETHQGRHLRLVPGRAAIQRVKLYRYR